MMALFFGHATSRYGFPRVTIYLLADIVLSAGMQGNVIDLHIGDWIENLTTGAIDITAYLVGGLALTLNHHAIYADTGLVVLNIILGTTIISELLGPLILMP